MRHSLENKVIPFILALTLAGSVVTTQPQTASDTAVMNVNPNPFVDSTNIKYSLDKGTNISILVRNHLGQIVNVLYDDKQSPGEHTHQWDGTDANGNKSLIPELCLN
ncbi:MAG: hypothetical protein ISR57_02445 [Bacteroidales bacterium]|nr:hypothetical protein [Bacteroidota bacterium]MBL6949480.1 hypothetical protein [Bacteroidales bacterium]